MTPTPSRLVPSSASTPSPSRAAQEHRHRLIVQHVALQSHDDNSTSRTLREVEFLTSRLADSEMQLGDIIPLLASSSSLSGETGTTTYVVTQTFVKGGAYISLLRSQSHPKRCKIVCRGTAMHRGARGRLESGLNTLLPVIGSRAVFAIWPDLLRYIRETGMREIEVLGKSMGGACAQLLVVLLQEVEGIEVTSMRTFCSVGVGEEVNKLFQERVWAKRVKPIDIFVVRAGGNEVLTPDYIPTVGGVHLGFKASLDTCNVTVCYIAPSASTEDDNVVAVVESPVRQGRLSLLRRFITSFSDGHARQTTLEPFSYHFVNEDRVDEELDMGTWLESWRRHLVRWLPVSRPPSIATLVGHS